MSKARRRPRHRRAHRATRVAAPVVLGGAVAVAAFGAAPLADRLRPGGPVQTTDGGGASTGSGSPDVVLVQPAGTAAPAEGGSSRAARSRAATGGPTAASRSAQRAAAASTAATPTPTATGSTPSGSASPSPTSSPATSSPSPSDPEPSDPVPLPLPTLTGSRLPTLPSLPTSLPTLPLP